MDYRIDEKGKVFTTHVTKHSVVVTARIGDAIVHGEVHLVPGNRLKDELNNGEQFIAITNARVVDPRTERVLYETPAMIANKAHVEWIFPIESKDTVADSSAE